MSRDERKIGRRDFRHGASAEIAASPLLGASRLGIEPASDIRELLATELSRAIRKREVRCVEVMRAYLEWRTWFTFQHWSASGADEIYENSGIRSLVKPEVVWEIEGSFDLTTAQSKEAGVAPTAWHRALLDLFACYDVLALPSAQVFPFRRRDPLAKVERRQADGHLSPLDGGRHRRHAAGPASREPTGWVRRQGETDGHPVPGSLRRRSKGPQVRARLPAGHAGTEPRAGSDRAALIDDSTRG